MNQLEVFFLDKLRRFKNLEKEFLKFTYETKSPADENESNAYFDKIFDLAFEALKLKNEILGEMHDVSDLQMVDMDAKMTLNQLRKNEKFHSLSCAENLASLINAKTEDIYNKVETDLRNYFIDKVEDFQNDFHSWFYIPDYYFRKAQVGAIITSSKVPKNITQYFEEIKEAFAFGLDRSVISLSRALIEIGLHDKLKKKGHFKSAKVIQFDPSREDQLSRYIYLSHQFGLLNRPLKDLAHEVRKTANNVLHIKDTEGFSVRGRALKTISDTVEIIEFLYK